MVAAAFSVLAPEDEEARPGLCCALATSGKTGATIVPTCSSLRCMCCKNGVPKPEVLDLLSRVNDSKQLTEQQRESLFEARPRKARGSPTFCLSQCSGAGADGCKVPGSHRLVHCRMLRRRDRCWQHSSGKKGLISSICVPTV